MENGNPTNFFLRHIRAVIASLVLLLAVVLWSQFGLLKIEISADGENSTITYQLLNQGSQKKKEFKSSSKSVTKIVSRGSYEILVKQNAKNFFVITKTKGFLGRTIVSGSLVSEQARQFVGDGPSSCMHYNGQTLLTYDCGAPINTSKIHEPATAKQPTFIQKNQNASVGQSDSIEGIVKTNEGTLILMRVVGQTTSHVLYRLQNDFTLTDAKTLVQLDAKKTYSIQKFKAGFLVHDDTYTSMLYYGSRNFLPASIDMQKVDTQQFRPYASSIKDDAIVVAFTKLGYEPVGDDAKLANSPSRLTVNQNGKFKILSLNKTYASFALCGSSKLCLLGDKGLEVYDISGTTQRLLYSISGVFRIQNSAHGLLAARYNEIFELDIDKQTGFVGYSLGNYTYCGLEPDDSGYTICLTNPKQKRVALHVDQSSIANDDIDKKVLELLKLSEVTDVSAYKQFIFVSPDLGQPVANPQTGFFEYSAAKRSQVNQLIQQKVRALGIDQTKYKVVNTIP